METTIGLFDYTACSEFGIAAAWSDITGSLLFFESTRGRGFGLIR